MSDTLPIIDAYAHVGLPRFQSVEHYQGVMQRNGIGQAVLCSFDSSPDFAPIHAAFSTDPQRFRGIGVPLGNDRAEMETAARAQLEAGFSALRLTESDLTERPWLLEMLAQHKRIAVVVGAVSSETCARILVDSLERHPELTVIGGHFAGMGSSPSLLASGPASALFAHPRFNVVFSRHGGFEPSALKAWSEAVLAKTGWSRLLWGSEAPVMFWRNETMASAIAWIDWLGPSAQERDQFLSGNTQRLYFAAPLAVALLHLPFDPAERARRIPAGLWANGLPVDQELAGRLVADWLAAGGEGRLGDHLQTVLARALPPLPTTKP
ncbi:MAG: hypothetical protein JWR51_3798 [Devosia sp.]|uniref:amidohydrolase family protein n=1 Tax=Devosia sp. TaxID=1871048 RepID=UPI00262A31B9|nr:amidohydrolase family protein [Devosia sp.]MDB5530695.1 hypothetical protein [Devosia sp.]